MGHSRGGHIAFRVAQQRPDLLRKLILAEPGGELDATLDPDYKGGASPLLAHFTASAEKIAAGDVDGGLTVFVDTLEGPGHWQRVPPLMKQPLRDNAYTLIGQVRDNRPPFSKADAESISMPTLFIGGARTKGLLPKVLHALAAHVPDSKTAMIPNTTHPMFEQAPQAFSEIVLDFLARLTTCRQSGSTDTTCPIWKWASGRRRWSVSTARSAISAPGMPCSGRCHESTG